MYWELESFLDSFWTLEVDNGILLSSDWETRLLTFCELEDCQTSVMYQRMIFFSSWFRYPLAFSKFIYFSWVVSQLWIYFDPGNSQSVVNAGVSISPLATYTFRLYYMVNKESFSIVTRLKLLFLVLICCLTIMDTDCIKCMHPWVQPFSFCFISISVLHFLIIIFLLF